MRRLVLAISVLLALPVIAIVILAVLENQAADEVKAFCGRFKPGMPFAEVQRAAKADAFHRHRSVKDDEIRVGIYGMPLSLHVCTVEAADGKVTRAQYAHYD